MISAAFMFVLDFPFEYLILKKWVKVECTWPSFHVQYVSTRKYQIKAGKGIPAFFFEHTNTTKDDNVFLFFEHIQKIAKSREIEDDISDASRLEELGDFSEEECLLEFVKKVEQSVHLAAIATQQANKMEAMYNLMEEVAKNETQQPHDRDFERRE